MACTERLEGRKRRTDREAVEKGWWEGGRGIDR